MGLVTELRRRNVFRMAVLYAVAAWLIMQVAEVLIALAKLPDLIGPTTLILLALGFPIALIFSWFYELTPEGISLERDVETAESITHVTGRRMDFIVISLLCAGLILFAYDKWWMDPPPMMSVAVLPFENMSGDPEQEYFSDGISEELLNVLAQVPGLRVPARTSSFRFKGQNVDIAVIAHALNVAFVLEGSVRKSGNKLRITAQLIKADDGYHIWSNTYDRALDDIFAVQHEIAVAISDVLKTKLALVASEAVPRSAFEAPITNTDTAKLRKNQFLSNVPTTSPEAHEAYLKGRYLLNTRTSHGLNAAKNQFKYAIEVDPEYALAYSGLADAYSLLASYGHAAPADTRPKQKLAAYKALELDAASAEAHVSVGIFLAAHEWDWHGSERELKRAIEINPNYSLALKWYGSVLALMGRPEHLEMLQRAHELDPFSLRINVDLGLAYYYNEDYEKAIQQFRNTLELDPDFRPANGPLGLALIESGSYEDGIAQIEKGSGGALSVWLGYAFAKAGNSRDALAIAERWHQQRENTDRGATAIALIYVGLGQTDEAFNWLHKAIDDREASAATLKSYAYWKPLRSDPRYKELLRRTNLLD